MITLKEISAVLEKLIQNRNDAEAYIRDLEGRPEFDENDRALPCESPESLAAQKVLIRINQAIVDGLTIK